MLRKIKKILERPQVSKLEKDAADIDDRRSPTANSDIIKVMPLPLVNNSYSSEVITSQNNNVLPVIGSNAIPIPNGQVMNNNLALQMQNVQNQSVYQFSNCTSLHFGPVVINGGGGMVVTTPHNDSQSSQAMIGGPCKRMPKKKIKTTSIEAMMKCNDPLEFAEMNIIAENLGQGWRNVIRELGFSDGKIEQLHEENAVKGIKEVIYQFLKDWSERDENATIGSISTLLWRDHWEVVYLMKEHWKANKRSEKSGSDRSAE